MKRFYVIRRNSDGKLWNVDNPHERRLAKDGRHMALEEKAKLDCYWTCNPMAASVFDGDRITVLEGEELVELIELLLTHPEYHEHINQEED